MSEVKQDFGWKDKVLPPIMIVGALIGIAVTTYFLFFKVDVEITIGYEEQDVVEVRQSVSGFMDCWLSNENGDCFLEYIDNDSPFWFGLIMDFVSSPYRPGLDYTMNTEDFEEELGLDMSPTKTFIEALGFLPEEQGIPLTPIMNLGSVRDDGFAVTFVDYMDIELLENALGERLCEDCRMMPLDGQKIACVYAIIEDGQSTVVELYFIRRDYDWFLYEWIFS